ncbi:MAG: cation diffusion facilitator family transporter [Methylacidiphilales bacterium]|nr:cation diffusion facilitator family transporter [Candidatus Methylacidiphilales bacterium]
MTLTVSDPRVSAARLSIFSNTALTGAKILAGILTGSVSILAEAIHSGLDLAAAVVAYCAIRIATKPRDEDHHYGHGKFENLSGVIEALLIFVAAVWIIWESLHKLMHPAVLAHARIGIMVMAVSAGVNILVSRRLFRVAREYDSEALRADAWHLKTDVYTSLGVFGALVLAWLGGKLFPSANLQWLDPVCAIGVALLILKTSYDLTLSAGRDLLDVSLTANELEKIHAYLDGLIRDRATRFQAGHEPVLGYHKLRTRKSGPNRFIDLHLELWPGITLARAKDTCEKVESGILALFPNASVTIHPEPAKRKYAPKSSGRC